MGSLIKHAERGTELDGYSTLLPGDKTAVLHFPGLAGNFYEASFVLPFAQAFRDAGVGFVSCNTRGHDYLADAITAGEWVSKGAAHTLLNEYVEDLEAWCEWARQRSVDRVFLQAHSASAIALANLVLEERARVDGCIYLSPADMAVELAEAVSADRFESLKNLSREADSAPELMPVDALEGYLLSPSVYREFVSSESGWGVLKWQGEDQSAAVFRVPSLVTFGDEEASAVLSLQEVSSKWQEAGARVEILPGAGHSYRGRERQLTELVTSFVCG